MLLAVQTFYILRANIFQDTILRNEMCQTLKYVYIGIEI